MRSSDGLLQLPGLEKGGRVELGGETSSESGNCVRFLYRPGAKYAMFLQFG